MSDIDDVRTLIAAVKHQKDKEDDPVAFGKLWANDATYRIWSNGNEYGQDVNGRDAVVAFNVKNWAAGAHGSGDHKEVHLAEPPHITDLGAGKYLAIYNVVMFGYPEGKLAPVGSGIFEDTCVKEDGVWKILHRKGTLKRAPH